MPLEIESLATPLVNRQTQMPDVFVVGPTHGAYDEERKWKEEMYVYPLTAAMRQKRPPGW